MSEKQFMAERTDGVFVRSSDIVRF